jgi:hypothetical protein
VGWLHDWAGWLVRLKLFLLLCLCGREITISTPVLLLYYTKIFLTFSFKTKRMPIMPPFFFFFRYYDRQNLKILIHHPNPSFWTGTEFVSNLVGGRSASNLTYKIEIKINFFLFLI